MGGTCVQYMYVIVILYEVLHFNFKDNNNDVHIPCSDEGNNT